jgi:predicted metal-dependent HD superfamily phosphohydrolase
MKMSTLEKYATEAYTCFFREVFSDNANVERAFVEAASLVKGYRKPKRYYHTIEHAYKTFKVLSDCLVVPETVLFAAWYHDIVYVRERFDNEILSGLEAKRVLDDLECSEGMQKEVFDLIQATVYFGKDCIPDNKLTKDQMYLRDADFCILGSAWEDFYKYEKGIRNEYKGMVSSEEYVTIRGDFLRSLLHKPLIFYTNYFQDRYEIQARRNIQRAIKRLRPE